MSSARIRWACALGMTIAAPLAYAQHTYTFQPASGVWGDQTHWRDENNNQGTPNSGDTALIQGTRECWVRDAQVAKRIEVGSDAVLGIEGASLTIEDQYGGSDSVIDGTLYFKEVDDVTPELLVGYYVHLEGGGVITGRVANGYGPGKITYGGSALVDNWVTFGSDLTIVGSIHIPGPGVQNDGLLLVDGSQDVMKLGNQFQRVGTPLWGSGTFRVTAGLMKVGGVMLSNLNYTPHWEATSGRIWFTDLCMADYASHRHSLKVDGGTIEVDARFYTWGTVEVSDGLLDIDADLEARDRGLEFTGGTISVATGKSAQFYHWVP